MTTTQPNITEPTALLAVRKKIVKVVVACLTIGVIGAVVMLTPMILDLFDVSILNANFAVGFGIALLIPVIFATLYLDQWERRHPSVVAWFDHKLFKKEPPPPREVRNRILAKRRRTLQILLITGGVALLSIIVTMGLYFLVPREADAPFWGVFVLFGVFPAVGVWGYLNYKFITVPVGAWERLAKREAAEFSEAIDRAASNDY